MYSDTKSALNTPAGSRAASPTREAAPASPPRNNSGSYTNLLSLLKKPFQGWSKELLAARDGLDDDYNFPHIPRRGAELYVEPYYIKKDA